MEPFSSANKLQQMERDAMITPEQAADLAEALWRARAERKIDDEEYRFLWDDDKRRYR